MKARLARRRRRLLYAHRAPTALLLTQAARPWWRFLLSRSGGATRSFPLAVDAASAAAAGTNHEPAETDDAAPPPRTRGRPRRSARERARALTRRLLARSRLSSACFPAVAPRSCFLAPPFSLVSEPEEGDRTPGTTPPSRDFFLLPLQETFGKNVREDPATRQPGRHETCLCDSASREEVVSVRPRHAARARDGTAMPRGLRARAGAREARALRRGRDGRERGSPRASARART